MIDVGTGLDWTINFKSCLSLAADQLVSRTSHAHMYTDKHGVVLKTLKINDKCFSFLTRVLGGQQWR